MGKIKKRKDNWNWRRRKNISNELFKKYFTNYQSPSDTYKKLRETEGERNENQVYLVKLGLDRIKKVMENVSENRKFMTEENENIIEFVEGILYFNWLDQSRQGLKVLIPNKMLIRLPISLLN